MVGLGAAQLRIINRSFCPTGAIASLLINSRGEGSIPVSTVNLVKFFNNDELYGADFQSNLHGILPNLSWGK